MLQKLYEEADFTNESGMIFNDDCMNLMEVMISERERERERERENKSYNHRYTV